MPPPQGRRIRRAMEDVLEVYHVNTREVLVCLDETSKQLVRETRDAPPAAARGTHGAYDHEYQRNGVSNLFMLFAPLLTDGGGWRSRRGDRAPQDRLG